VRLYRTEKKIPTNAAKRVCSGFTAERTRDFLQDCVRDSTVTSHGALTRISAALVTEIPADSPLSTFNNLINKININTQNSKYPYIIIYFMVLCICPYIHGNQVYYILFILFTEIISKSNWIIRSIPISHIRYL
jgi:hypothetical protein